MKIRLLMKSKLVGTREGALNINSGGLIVFIILRRVLNNSDAFSGGGYATNKQG